MPRHGLETLRQTPGIEFVSTSQGILNVTAQFQNVLVLFRYFGCQFRSVLAEGFYEFRLGRVMSGNQVEGALKSQRIELLLDRAVLAEQGCS